MRAKIECVEIYDNVGAFCIVERHYISKIEQIHPKSNNFYKINHDKKSGFLFFQNFWSFGISSRKAFCTNLMDFPDILTLQSAKRIYIYQIFQRTHQ